MIFKYSHNLKQGYISTENGIYPINMEDFKMSNEDYWNSFIDEFGQVYDINIVLNSGIRSICVYQVKHGQGIDTESGINIINFKFLD